jgi:hypothetical protein
MSGVQDGKWSWQGKESSPKLAKTEHRLSRILGELIMTFAYQEIDIDVMRGHCAINARDEVLVSNFLF